MFIANRCSMAAPFGGAEGTSTSTDPVEFRSSERRMVLVVFFYTSHSYGVKNSAGKP